MAATDLIPLLVRALPDVQERLASEAGRDVDLVDLQAASTVMQARIVTTGRLLFEADPVERTTYEMNVLSAYALLGDIRTRGSIHAR